MLLPPIFDDAYLLTELRSHFLCASFYICVGMANNCACKLYCIYWDVSFSPDCEPLEDRNGIFLNFSSPELSTVAGMLAM